MVIGEVRVVGYGRPAGVALAGVIEAAKGGRPLEPVTVVVGSNFAGLFARRLLAAPDRGGRGLANVQFVTSFRLAELLVGDRPAGARPLTNPVLGAAVRRALSEQPAPLSSVAEHQATEVAFAKLYAELSHVSEATLDVLGEFGGLPASGVAMFRRIRALLTGFAGEDEVARAASGRPDLARAVGSLGHVVWYLPEPLAPALTGLLQAVLHAAPSTVILGVTGVEAADGPVLATCERAGVPANAVPIGSVPVGSHIVSVSDCDEEVRAVVRRIAALAEEGVRLDRIGVFYPSADPYLPTLAAQLADAGIPSNGPSGQRLSDRVAGRTLLAALALPGVRWRRDRVLALVADGPLRNGERGARPSAWEEISRAAGVVRDLSEWQQRLDGHRGALGRQVEALDRGAQAGQVARLERALADCEMLASFVTGLAGDVDAVARTESWEAKSDAARRLLFRLLGDERRRSGWPDAEVEAASRVDDALLRLSSLDEMDPGPSFEVFRRALSAELDEARGRSGRFGHGVVYGPLSGSVGQDFDAVFILGMAEGLCPSPRGEDALLPDAARRAAGPGELAVQADRIHDQHRTFLAALAAAPAGRRYLLFPRGDLRSGRTRLPSRWLLDTATVLAGRRVHSTDFADLGAPLVDVVASFPAGLRTMPAPASTLDYDLASLSGWTDGGGDARRHPATIAVRRGMDALAARRSAEFTVWDGNLAGHPVPSPASGTPLSASGLERWASCGYRYFLGSVLGVGDRDEPERVVELDPAERGSAVHQILERFVGEVIERGAPDPDTSWSPADRDRLQAIAAEVFATLEATGRTGRPLVWRLERQRLGLLLEAFLAADDAYRAMSRTRPERVELAFGMDGAPPAVIALRDGREVRLRGKADRVDVTDDGRRAVIDYKTGRGREYDKLDEGDPVRGGAMLQLGVYSEAAAQLLGATHPTASYWMVNEDARFAQAGYRWDDGRRKRFIEVVTAIVDGIEAGVFPAVPGEWDSWRATNHNCVYCDFDPVCPRERGTFSEAKIAAPQLRIRDVLTGPEDQR